jgi:hypothetical protein
MVYNSKTALSTILAYNPGLDCSALQTGQYICLDNIAPLICTSPYTVNWGDTCITIAERAGISFTTFIALNKPITCSALQYGQQLCLAKQGFTPYPVVTCTNKYTVQWGETCDSMVFNSKTPLSTILAYNPGLDCSALQTGQYICLDNAGVTTSTLASTTTTLASTTTTFASTTTTTKPAIITTTAPTTTAPTTVVSTTTASTTTSTASSLPVGCLDEFRKAALAAHNTFRAKHSAQSMIETVEVDTSAQAYANQLAVIGSLVHSTNRVNTGENLAWFSSRPTTAAQCASKLNILFSTRLSFIYFLKNFSEKNSLLIASPYGIMKCQSIITIIQGLV